MSGSELELDTDRPPELYEIRVEGHLRESWGERLYAMALTHLPDGTTIIRGPLPDQTALHSVLNRIRDMNLELLSVLRVEGSESEEPAARSAEQTV